MTTIRSLVSRRALPAAVLGVLILLLLPACTVRYVPDMLVPVPPPGPTVVQHANVPDARCSVGRIGLNINDALEVIGFTGYSPARNAGLRFGDIVRTIDGVSPRSLSEAQMLASGRPGTYATITVWRHTAGRMLTFNVRRECL